MEWQDWKAASITLVFPHFKGSRIVLAMKRMGGLIMNALGRCLKLIVGGRIKRQIFILSRNISMTVFKILWWMPTAAFTFSWLSHLHASNLSSLWNSLGKTHLQTGQISCGLSACWHQHSNLNILMTTLSRRGYKTREELGGCPSATVIGPYQRICNARSLSLALCPSS